MKIKTMYTKVGSLISGFQRKSVWRGCVAKASTIWWAPQGKTDETGCLLSQAAVGGGPRGRERQAAQGRGRTVRVGEERETGLSGAVHATAYAQKTVETACGTVEHEAHRSGPTVDESEGGQTARGRCAGLVKTHLPRTNEKVSPQALRFVINKEKIKMRRRLEGRYLLRLDLAAEDPSRLWKKYWVLTEVEQASNELKSGLAVRPIYNSKDERIEAHIFVVFMAYCLNVTLKNQLKRKASDWLSFVSRRFMKSFPPGRL